MINEISHTCSRASLALGVLLLSSLYASSAFAFDNGSILSNQNCSQCHSLDVATLMITGPDQVLPDSVNTFTLTITDGSAVIGGLDVFVDDGFLSVVSAGTQLNSGEITHTSPKDFSAGSVSWDFDWMAPTLPGVYSIFAQGVGARSGGSSGNDAAGMTFREVVVAQIPIPAAAILFGSGLGFLGWFRRRTTKS